MAKGVRRRWKETNRIEKKSKKRSGRGRKRRREGKVDASQSEIYLALEENAGHGLAGHHQQVRTYIVSL